MGSSLTFTLTLAFISAFANIGGSAEYSVLDPILGWPPAYCYEEGGYNYDCYYDCTYDFFCDEDNYTLGEEAYWDHPTTEPTFGPTTDNSSAPSGSPSGSPSVSPTVSPSESPTVSPSESPSAPVAPTDAPVAPTDAPTDFLSSTPTTSTTAAPTEFDCDTDQVLTVAVETDDYFAETSWVVEKYENDVWTEVASTTMFTSTNLLFTSNICLDEAGVYRFSIFDSSGDGLCFGNNCGFFKVRLNGNVIAEGDSFVFQDVTDFNTCVNESGEFTYQYGTRGQKKSATCDQLRQRQRWGGGIACRENNLDGLGLVRDFCPNTCGFFGEGECASPNSSWPTD